MKKAKKVDPCKDCSLNGDACFPLPPKKEKSVSDSEIMPIGLNKGKRFREIPLEDIDKLIGWIEDKNLIGQFRDLYDKMVRYLKQNKFGED